MWQQSIYTSSLIFVSLIAYTSNTTSLIKLFGQVVGEEIGLAACMVWAVLTQNGI